MMNLPDVFSCLAPLFSYVDPVSGVILLQLLIGGCIGYFAFTARKFGRFFLRMFRREESEAMAETLPCEARVALEQPTAVNEQKPSYSKAA
jgi:hypothetical protein